MVWQQEHRFSYESFIERFNAILLLFAGLFLFLSIRLFYLQVISGAHYLNVSEQQRTYIIQERAPRGVIYDKNGKTIVGNRTAFVALFYPFAQDKSPSKKVLNQLENIIQLESLPKLLSEAWRSKKVLRLAENLSRRDMFKLQELRLMVPGIQVVKEIRREYINPYANCHLSGYLGEITKSELNRMSGEGYKLGDWVGKGGLEKIYDLITRGQDGGWQVEVDASGRQTRLVKHILPLQGAHIFTTIDSDLQAIARKALSETSSGKGAVIGIDPRSGAVRIFVSAPGYDPNISFEKDFAKLLKDKELPLFNRTVQALYPPGSIFKLITFIGAVAENKADTEDVFKCQGSFKFGNKVFKCWKKEGHGKVNLLQALEKSCNVYFYQLGLKTGEEILYKYADMFNIGKLSGIEFPSEKAGLLPNAEWKRKKLKEPWHPGDTINMAIGQGPLWTTPMQIAVMVSAIANRGTIFKPYIVEKIVSTQNTTIYEGKPEIKNKIELEERVWGLVRQGMLNVVKDGTGRGSKLYYVDIAGKTGTAQNPQGEDHSWFCAFAPYENPELAIVVIVENGGSGGKFAAPAAGKVFEKAFREKYIEYWKNKKKAKVN